MLIPLGLKAAAGTTDAGIKKRFKSGSYDSKICGSRKTLIISNEDTEDHGSS